MKYLVLLADGMADYPLEELRGKSPLQAAQTPHMDRLAREGSGGRLKTIPRGMTPGSDVANLSILGYDPGKCYSGRGPLEAASLGIKLEEDELAFRCNLVTVAENRMIDYSAGHIGTEEGRALIELLENKMGGQGIRFYPGISYRHILVVKEQLLEEGRGKLKTTPPHDITGKNLEGNMPRGSGGEFLINLMTESRIILKDHEINEIRIDLGENPATMIWPWGEGKRPHLSSFLDKFGIQGALISAVDLLKGIASLSGLELIEVPGATGYFDTDYRAKGAAARQALEKYDLVYLHVEAPDEAGHAGNITEKIRALEEIDGKILGQFRDIREQFSEIRIAVLPDHATPVSVRTHTSDPVPFIIWGEGIEPDGISSFSEEECGKGRYRTRAGYKFMPLLLRGDE